jgi:hypothetical protein
MTRYSRPADTLNPALDLGAREAFGLNLGDGNGSCSYPRNWFERATPEEIAACGFTAYEPPPPPPPEPTPESTSLSRVQLRLVLFMPLTQGGFGFTDADVRAFIRSLPAGQKEAAEIRFDHAESFNWDHPFIQALVPVVMSAKGMTLNQVRTAWMQASVL